MERGGGRGGEGERELPPLHSLLQSTQIRLPSPASRFPRARDCCSPHQRAKHGARCNSSCSQPVPWVDGWVEGAACVEKEEENRGEGGELMAACSSDAGVGLNE